MLDFIFNHSKWVEDRRREREAREHAAQHRVDVQKEYIASGRQLTMICGSSDTGLHVGERLICVLPGSEMYEPRSVRVYQGGSRGTSIRVAKGVSFRVGASRGYSESHDEMRLLDSGTFIITSERVIFCGSMRTLSMGFDQIIGTQMYTDGLRVSTEKRAKPCTFTFNTSLTSVIDGATFFANGPFINCILDQAKILRQCPKGKNPAEFMRSVAVSYT